MSLPKRFLIGVKNAEDVNGAAGFIDGIGNNKREPLHGFAANIFISNGRGGRYLRNTLQTLVNDISNR